MYVDYNVDYIEASSSVRNTGVIFFSHVNLEKHVMNTCKMAFYHLRNIARIRNCLSQDDAETLVHAYNSSKLDFLMLFYMAYPNRLLISYNLCKTVQLEWWPENEAQNT